MYFLIFQQLFFFCFVKFFCFLRNLCGFNAITRRLFRQNETKQSKKKKRRNFLMRFLCSLIILLKMKKKEKMKPNFYKILQQYQG